MSTDTQHEAIPKELHVGATCTTQGISILLNGKHFPIKYPAEIWNSCAHGVKFALRDTLALSSTMFLPQILNTLPCTYETAQPLAEPYLFMNGMFDMTSSAISDGASSREYIVRLYNARPTFSTRTISRVAPVAPSKKTGKQPTAIIPFSLGKESMLSIALCRELGIQPILVNFVEPAQTYEYEHKKKLIRRFEKEVGEKVYTVYYGPGLFRYGKLWGCTTELGWGLQTTEYAMLCVPFAIHFDAQYLILGNEQSCNDTYMNKERIFTYKAGIDQHTDWTSHQGMLASLLSGKNIEVCSFVEPLYEIAITKILHTRYPLYGKFQMSCGASTEHAKGGSRWCGHCTKCGYMYAMCTASGVDTALLGFNGDLFDQQHAHIFEHFFKYDAQAVEYGSEEELGLAFLLTARRGIQGYSIERFKKTKQARIAKREHELRKQYLGTNTYHHIPREFAGKLSKIYAHELGSMSK